MVVDAADVECVSALEDGDLSGDGAEGVEADAAVSLELQADFMLANSAFLEQWTSNEGVRPKATVAINNGTEHTSDHYPIELRRGPLPGYQLG